MKIIIIAFMVLAIATLIGLFVELYRETLAIERDKVEIRIHSRRYRTHRALLCDIEYELETLDIPEEYKN